MIAYARTEARRCTLDVSVPLCRLWIIGETKRSQPLSVRNEAARTKFASKSIRYAAFVALGLKQSSNRFDRDLNTFEPRTSGLRGEAPFRCSCAKVRFKKVVSYSTTMTFPVKAPSTHFT